MPTIDDLRAALFSLEGEAPAIDELLSKATATAAPSLQRPRRSLLPAVVAAVAVALVVGVLHELHGHFGVPSGAGHAPSRTAAGSHGRLLPLQLTSSLAQLTVIDAHSDTDPTTAAGTVVVAEYGMEVTIEANVIGSSTHSAAASPVDVNGIEGWIDTGCGTRPAPTSPVPTVNLTCSLSFKTGPWHVAIYVAGPGGGSRQVTPQQFLEIGDRLKFADSASDTSTWFGADTFLPR
jgi:hypothetical protein